MDLKYKDVNINIPIEEQLDKCPYACHWWHDITEETKEYFCKGMEPCIFDKTNNYDVDKGFWCELAEVIEVEKSLEKRKNE